MVTILEAQIKKNLGKTQKVALLNTTTLRVAAEHFRKLKSCFKLNPFLSRGNKAGQDLQALKLLLNIYFSTSGAKSHKCSGVI